MSTKEGSLPDSATDAQSQNVPRTRVNADPSMTPRQAPPGEIPLASSSNSSRPHSPVSSASLPIAASIVNGQQSEENDPFDYQATVNELTVQFLSEFEETRVAALKWLIMLHQKAPKKVCKFFLVSFSGL
jgi:vacuole morphology and inheritance protein 14